MAQKHIRLDDKLMLDIENISKENNVSFNQTVIDSLKLFRDYHHMQNKSVFINDQILSLTKSMVNNLERNINYKTNKYLSELVIQLTISNMIMASNLEIDTSKLSSYRRAALTQVENSKAILSLEKLLGD